MMFCYKLRRFILISCNIISSNYHIQFKFKTISEKDFYNVAFILEYISTEKLVFAFQKLK